MRWRRPVYLLLLGAAFLMPRPAAAQSGGWTVDFVPFYFWAMSLEGDLATRSATVPIDLEFSEAKDHLSGAFSFHLEASRGRWGTLVDLNFIGLESDADFTVAGRPVTGSFELDNVIFEAGATYLAHEAAQVSIVGGLRTYTVAPRIDVTAMVGGATPVDVSVTSPNAFGGVIFRPRLSERWTLISRADAGGGDANLTWSAEAGVGFRIKRWIGLTAGYKALGIDVEFEDRTVRQYDVVHHGPFFGLDFHWGQ